MRGLFILLLFAFGPLVGAQDNAPEKERKSGRGSKFYEAIRLPIHMFRLNSSKAKTTAITKVNYGPDKRQHLLICESENLPAYRREGIFFVHGGGWHVGKPKQHRLLAELLAKAGYLVVLPGYRLAPEVSAAEMQDDIHQALRATMNWLEENKKLADYKIVVGGASAGGNLGALLVFDEPNLQKYNISPNIFAGFFSMAGVLDLETMPETKVLRRYAGPRTEDAFCQSNPLYHLEEGRLVPVLCIHGDKDGLVDYKTAQTFAERLCQMHCELLEFHTIPNGTHLATASQWYYKKKKDEGQGAILLRWLHRLDSNYK